MFSVFQKEGDKSLIIRTELLLRIEDVSEGCLVFWTEGNEPILRHSFVQGTAAENYARLQSEELRLIEAAAERQRRYDRDFPLSPIPRGRAGR